MMLLWEYLSNEQNTDCNHLCKSFLRCHAPIPPQLVRNMQRSRSGCCEMRGKSKTKAAVNRYKPLHLLFYLSGLIKNDYFCNSSWLSSTFFDCSRTFFLAFGEVGAGEIDHSHAESSLRANGWNYSW